MLTVIPTVLDIFFVHLTGVIEPGRLKSTETKKKQ